MYSFHVYTLKKAREEISSGRINAAKLRHCQYYKWMFFPNLQSLLNLILKFRVTHYFKSVIRTIIIEYNKSFVKKTTFNKKPGFFVEKTQPSGLNGYIPGYIPRPTLNRIETLRSDGYCNTLVQIQQ